MVVRDLNDDEIPDFVRFAEREKVELRFIGWWWKPEEHAQFAEWMDREAPGRAVSISLHLPYGKTAVADVRLPKGCERHAFVHIGYADDGC